MNNFEERIAETLLIIPPTCETAKLLRDLHAALQAKDAEIVELKIELRKAELDNKDLRHIILNNEGEIAELRGLLGEARDDIKAQVEHEYKDTLDYPIQKRRYDRDMDIANRITAALAGKEQPKC